MTRLPAWGSIYPRWYIQKRVDEIGKSISEEFPDDEITLLCVLSGASIFAADLARSISRAGGWVRLEFCKAQSRRGTESTQEVNFSLPVPCLTGQHVVIVEDIIDTGLTINAVTQQVAASNPQSLRVCALLHRLIPREERKLIIYPSWSAFTADDDTFFVGYGLDYEGKYRDLPYITKLAP